MADDAPCLQLVERAQEDRPVLDASALVELAAVAGRDAVLKLAQADRVGALAEARGPAHDVEQGFEGRFPQLGRYVIEYPIRGSGGRPGGGERGIDGHGSRLYAHSISFGSTSDLGAKGACRLISAKNFTAGARFLLGEVSPRSVVLTCT